MEINKFFKQNYTVTILCDLYLSPFTPDQYSYMKNIYIYLLWQNIERIFSCCVDEADASI